MIKMPYDHCLLLVSLEGEGCGVIESRLLKEKVRFSTPEELLLRIEQILDVQNSPQSTETLRKFYHHRKSAEKLPLTPFEHDLSPAGESGHQFLLAIRSRHFADWQGTLHHLDGRQMQHFQSVVELADLLLDNHYFGVSEPSTD